MLSLIAVKAPRSRLILPWPLNTGRTQPSSLMRLVDNGAIKLAERHMMCARHASRHASRPARHASRARQPDECIRHADFTSAIRSGRGRRAIMNLFIVTPGSKQTARYLSLSCDPARFVLVVLGRAGSEGGPGATGPLDYSRQFRTTVPDQDGLGGQVSRCRCDLGGDVSSVLLPPTQRPPSNARR